MPKLSKGDEDEFESDMLRYHRSHAGNSLVFVYGDDLNVVCKHFVNVLKYYFVIIGRIHMKFALI